MSFSFYLILSFSPGETSRPDLKPFPAKIKLSVLFFVSWTMPKIFQYLSFIIRFYTNDHLPVHVHVQIQQREAKAEFQISGENVTLIFKKVKGKQSITETEAKKVAVFLKAYHKEIITKWETVFIYHKRVKFEKIAKSLGKK